MVIINDNELNELRKRIDEIDSDLLKDIEKRFEIVKKIAERKKKMGFPIRDLQREKEIINSRCSETNLPRETIQKIYQLLIDESVRIEGERK